MAGKRPRDHRPPKRGPRGGTTTITSSGFIRKNLWITHEENERLRRKAFEERRSESHVIRSGLRAELGLDALEPYDARS